MDSKPSSCSIMFFAFVMFLAQNCVVSFDPNILHFPVVQSLPSFIYRALGWSQTAKERGINQLTPGLQLMWRNNSWNGTQRVCSRLKRSQSIDIRKCRARFITDGLALSIMMPSLSYDTTRLLLSAGEAKRRRSGSRKTLIRLRSEFKLICPSYGPVSGRGAWFFIVFARAGTRNQLHNVM